MKKETFASQLRTIMKDKKIKQTELAQALGVQRQQVSRWLNTNRIPRQETIDKISKILGVEIRLSIEEMMRSDDLLEPLEKMVNGSEVLERELRNLKMSDDNLSTSTHFTITFSNFCMNLIETIRAGDDELKLVLLQDIDTWESELKKIKKVFEKETFWVDSSKKR